MTVVAFEPYVGKAGVAAAFDVSVRTVNYWMAEGLRPTMIGGRCKFRLTEVDAWLERSGNKRSAA